MPDLAPQAAPACKWEQLLSDLESRQLHVMLDPAPRPAHEWHFIRVAVEKNPRWYSRLCEKYPSSRRDNANGRRTKIKRMEICRLLARLAAGLPVKSEYLADLETAAADL